MSVDPHGGSVKVCDKLAAMDVILKDRSLAELHVQFELERQASSCLMQALVIAMERGYLDPLIIHG